VAVYKEGRLLGQSKVLLKSLILIWEETKESMEDPESERKKNSYLIMKILTCSTPMMKYSSKESYSSLRLDTHQHS